MEKYLIINADDFGMCHAQNQAIIDLFARGGITSSTIMAPCAWALEATQFAVTNPQFAVGVHLTTTSEWGSYRWSPITGGSTLMDAEMCMPHTCAEFAAAADSEQVRDELAAQVDRLLRWGLVPSHADSHMGSMYGVETGRFELLAIAVELAGRYGLPFRLPTVSADAQLKNGGLDKVYSKEQMENLLRYCRELMQQNRVAMPDYLIPGEWNGPQADNYENYREYIYELYRSFEPGVTETYIHPAVECDELKAITDRWQWRVWEYRLFSDPQTLQHIDSLGIRLINYRDLKAMRGY